MADPVSWLLIEPGWKVVDREGGSLGDVTQVVGDGVAGIFSGLVVAAGLMPSGDTFVPAELVAEMVEGEISLSIGADEFERLEAHEPGTTPPE